MRKKIFSILILIVLLLNSSLLTIVSTAVDDVKVTIEQANSEETSTSAKEKISMNLSYTKLTNKVANSLILTGVLENNAEGSILYENPVVYFEFPQEVEKVVVNDVKLLYEEELELQDYTVEKNESGNQVIKVALSGKQTELHKDEIAKGANIRIVANVILKQDIKTTDFPIKMKCGDAVFEKEVKLINVNEESSSDKTSKEEGTTVYANGLMINTKAILGDTLLKDGDTIYSNEIIKYEVKVKNTTENVIDNVKIRGYVPDNMTYVEYDEKSFEDYWTQVYTFIDEEGKVEGTSVYWQDDDLQYKTDETVKTKEINVGSLQKGETKTYFYELEVNKDLPEEQEIESKIDLTINDEIISTYNLKNTAKKGVFETRIRTYISRNQDSTQGTYRIRNEWVYQVIVKNTSGESQNANVTLRLPSSLKVSLVETDREEDAETFKYKLEKNVITVNYENIEANGYRVFSATAKVEDIEVDENNLYEIYVGASVEDKNKNIYFSNQSRAKGGIEAGNIVASSESDGKTLNSEDEVEYVFEVENTGYVLEALGGYSTYSFLAAIPKQIKITDVRYNTNTVSINGKTITATPIDKVYSYSELKTLNRTIKDDYIVLNFKLNIKVGEKSTIRVKGNVKSLEEQENDSNVECAAVIKDINGVVKYSNIITNTLHKVEKPADDDNKPDKPIEGNPGEETPSKEPEQMRYSISGTAWIDANENGKRDGNELLKSGIRVILFDVNNNRFLEDTNGKVVETKTDKEGKYSFEKVPEGKYYVVFEYDTKEYSITDYQKAGVTETINNDAIERVARLFGEQKTIGITNTINLTENKNDINIGFKENKIFDLKMEQFVQKITVTNSKGTKEYNYNNKKLAKIEIHSKQFAGSTVVIEYKLVITNVGEVSGYVYEILDQIPSELDFHSELNKGWSKSSANISNTNYMTKEIAPGESIEAVITLSKKLDNDSNSRYINTSSIKLSDSIKHTSDINAENDTDTTEVIIGVATGLEIAIKIISMTLLVLIIIALCFMFLRKKLNRKIINKTLMILMIICVTTTVYLKDVPISYAGIIGEIGEWIGDHFGGGSGDNTGGNTGGNTGDNTGEGEGEGEGEGDNTGGSIEEPKVECNGNVYNSEEEAYNDLKEHYPDANLQPGMSVQEMEEAIELYNYTQSCIDAYPGIDLSGCTSMEEAEEKVDQYRCDQLASQVGMDALGPDGIDFSGCNNYEEYLNKYNEVCNEKRADLGGQIASNPNIDASAVDTSKMDYVQLTNALNTIEQANAVPDRTIITGDPNTYWVDKDGHGHFDEFIMKDLDGNVVNIPGLGNKDLVSCTTPTKNQSQYVNENSYYTMSTEVKINSDGTVDLKISGQSDCGNNYQKMGGDYSKGGSVTMTPDVDSDFGISIVPPSGGDDPGYEPDYGGIYITLYKVDVDTQQNLYEIVDGEVLSEFLFRIKGTDITFKPGERVSVEQNKTYLIEEIKAPFGYEVFTNKECTEYKTIPVTTTSDLEGYVQTKFYVKVNNALTKLKLEGYVWEDIARGKSQERNDEYDGKYDDNRDKLLEGIRVLLYEDGKVVGERYTDSQGKYSFGEQRADGSYTDDTIDAFKLKDGRYHVEFEYNGMKYTNVIPKVNQSNGSKAIEGTANRTNYNVKYSSITSEGRALNENGQISVSGINYNRDYNNYQSKVIYGDNTIYNGTTYSGSTRDYDAYGFDKYHIRASTHIAGEFEDYNFQYVDPDTGEVKDPLEYVDEDRNEQWIHKNKTVINVNLGLYAREQVDLGVDSDVKQLDVSVNNYHHIYTYRGLEGTTIMDAPMDAKLGAIKGKTYERKLHQSSIAYAANNGSGANGDVYVDITYKIFMKNKSSSLNATINELVLNYDSQLEFVQYNYENEGAISGDVQERVLESNANIKEITLNNLGSKVINAQTKNVLEVTLRAKANVVADILNHEDGLKLDFMAEIKTYSTYEGGAHYASIDSNSAPRNASVLIDGDGQFITDTFENDTTIAPRFILSKGEQTIISGTVFEDSPIAYKLDDNERIGDGEYKDGEKGVKDVKVELLLLPSGERDAALTARDDKYKQNYDVALLYDSDKVNEPTKAQTYTDENGNYSFAGVVAGNYVIRYTYGENVTYVDGSEERDTTINEITIKAREYKSTIVTSEYIRNGINTTGGTPHLNGNWSWFLNDKEDGNTRYSDAVDDIEYRAHYEETAVLNNSNLNDSTKYAYQNVEAYTPFFKLGVEADDDQNIQTTLTTDGKGNLYNIFDIKNADFGVIERPRVDLQVDKQITNVKVTLGNGQVPIDGNPTTDNLPYVKSRLDDFVPIELDTEIIVGATLKQQYTISVTNNSELDYPIYKETDNTVIADSRNYYYYGDVGAYAGEKISTKLDMLVDYVSPELDVNLEEMKENGWEIKEVKDLYEDGRDINLVTEDVKNKLDSGKYKIFTTNVFANEVKKLVTIGDTQSISYEVSRLLTSKDEMKYTNDVEILQYAGYSQNKATKNGNTVTTPGNLIPEYAREDDEDSVRTTITPPTGSTISKIVYLTTALTGLMVIVIGIVFIRKRVLCK